MEPLWKIRSGRFAGWRSNDKLFDEHGDNVGYFQDDMAYSLGGRYLGEIRDQDWIGKRQGIFTPCSAREVPSVGLQSCGMWIVLDRRSAVGTIQTSDLSRAWFTVTSVTCVTEKIDAER